MIPHTQKWLRVIRRVLALVVAIDLLSLPYFIGDARSMAVALGNSISPVLQSLSSSPFTWFVSGCGLVATILFARRSGSIAGGLVALASLSLLSGVHARLFGSPWRHLFFSGVCLCGWVIGQWVAQRSNRQEGESFGRIGSIALLGAAYFNSGVSKMVYGGLEWLSGHTIQFVVIAQDGLVADGPLSLLRAWVASTPQVAMLFSIATVGFELAGPLMLVGGKTRLLVSFGLLSMHTLIYLLTHIIYWESVTLLLLFGLSSDIRSSSGTSDAMPLRVFSDRRFALIAMMLGALAAMAVGHQARRFAFLQREHANALSRPYTSAIHSGEEKGAGPQNLSAASLPEPQVVEAVGPFRLGAHLGVDWVLQSLRLGDKSFELTLSGAKGKSRFEITCADSPHDSPFDLPPAHIFYSQDLPFTDIETVGRELQEQLQREAGSRICETISAWVEAAGGKPGSQAAGTR